MYKTHSYPINLFSTSVLLHLYKFIHSLHLHTNTMYIIQPLYFPSVHPSPNLTPKYWTILYATCTHFCILYIYVHIQLHHIEPTHTFTFHTSMYTYNLCDLYTPLYTLHLCTYTATSIKHAHTFTFHTSMYKTYSYHIRLSSTSVFLHKTYLAFYIEPVHTISTALLSTSYKLSNSQKLYQPSTQHIHVQYTTCTIQHLFTLLYSIHLCKKHE